MDEHIQFDREKFKDVVHYVVSYVVSNYGTDALGNTKLHKALYFSDMLKFLQSGCPLTGVDYQRQQFGPTARHLTACLKELERERRVETRTVDYYGFPKREFLPLNKPKTDRLSHDDLSLIEEMAAFVCSHTATEISEFSHDDVWSSVSMGERIPYFAAYGMFPCEITDEDMQEAAIESLEIAPQIEAELERRPN